MYYYKARIYSAKLGRFLQTDPIGYKDQVDLYAYVGNDPINRIDATGTQAVPAVPEVAPEEEETREERAADPYTRRFGDNGEYDKPRYTDAYMPRSGPDPFGIYRDPLRTYQTYTKTNPETGEVYSGRTSGTGNARQNVADRDARHTELNNRGFGPARLDRSSTDPKAIRGREQQQIERNGGAQRGGGTSGNKINGVSPKNPNLADYMKAACEAFGLCK